MKWIKLFDNFNEYSQYGITPEDVDECFYEIVDAGWDIKIIFDKKMMSGKVDRSNGTMNFELIPFIEVRILKWYNTYVSNIEESEELFKLKHSEVYKDSMVHLNGILDEAGLYIKEEKIEAIKSSEGGSQIFILIYRKADLLK